MSNESDVVIVGGGPVGLWLACELALAKVKVTVLERRTERVTQSRALSIHGRTLEVFALRGIVDRFLTRGRAIPSGHFGALDTRLDFSVIDSRFPFMLLLPQAVSEEILEQRALELGVEIRRAHFAELLSSMPAASLSKVETAGDCSVLWPIMSLEPTVPAASCAGLPRSILSDIRHGTP